MDAILLSAGPRRPGHGYLFTLGPGGTVSPPQQIPASHPMFDDYPRPLRMPYLFDERLAAAVPAAAHGPRGGKRARAAASEEAILGLPEVAGRSRSGEDCAVCLQDFRADETLRAMPCSHAFHHCCISQWLRRSAVCPLCRHRLPEEEDGDEERKRRRNV